MEWLTAILAFATTMLVFSMITTTIVETIHRLLGSRIFGLIMMLEHLYDNVMSAYLDDDQKQVQREALIKRMILVRSPAVPLDTSATDAAIASPPAPTDEGIVSKIVRQLRSIWFRLHGASRTAHDLGVRQWHLLSHLPVETFMERLGSSKFAQVLKTKYANKPEVREQVLKDIAQKFELYGQEAGIYFERKARVFAIMVALIVAWTFYVHPYHLIQTYLQQPEVAAKVAELGHDLVEELDEIEKKLPTVKDDGTIEDEIKEMVSNVEARLNSIRSSGAPVSWSKDKGSCWNGKTEELCWFNLPEAKADIFWLLLGGLLVGLGAPFWARAVRQIAEIQNAPKEIAKILKPEAQQGSTQGQQTTKPAPEKPLTTEAFDAAAAGEQAR